MERKSILIIIGLFVILLIGIIIKYGPEDTQTDVLACDDFSYGNNYKCNETVEEPTNYSKSGFNFGSCFVVPCKPECTCKLITFKNGTQITRGCSCWTPLTVCYECLDEDKIENVTTIVT